MTILFVCTGNTCRSPLAWAFWRAGQRRGEVPLNWSAFSAGLSPSVGEAVSGYAIEIARGWGVDLDGYGARAVDAGALRQVDVCVAISHSHARALSRMLRSLDKAPRLLCLSDFVPGPEAEDSVARLLGDDGGAASEAEEVEIADPYGGSREAYEACASLIASAVPCLVHHLREEQGSDARTSSRSDERPESNEPEQL